MTDRYHLVARKQDVRQRIERLQRQLEYARSQDGEERRRHIRKVENALERLMAEEYRLRLMIDQSR